MIVANGTSSTGRGTDNQNGMGAKKSGQRREVPKKRILLHFSLPNTTILNWAVEVYFVWTSTGFYVLTAGLDLGSNFEVVCTIFQVILNYKTGY